MSSSTKRALAWSVAVASALASHSSATLAQSHNVRLHVNPRWDECSIQLDPSLTQAAWRQFTREAAVVVHFRPLTDAVPMGRGQFEISAHQWQSNIDDTDAAWNDTFVHPDSTHWLFEGSGLQFPGVTARAGVADRTDVGIYFTRNFRANYGFYGAQVQQNFMRSESRNWHVAARASYIRLFGPEDVDFSVQGLDAVVSRKYDVFSRRASLAPYAVLSGTWSRTHEKTAAVSLTDESVFGGQATVGVEARYSVLRVGLEYGMGAVPTTSFKLGFGPRATRATLR